MEIIIGGRGSGKTHKLIELCKKMNEDAGINDTVIVALNHDDACNIMDMARNMGYKGMPFPLTLNEVRAYGPTIYRRLLIDNIDVLMQQVVAPFQLIGFTLTHSGDK
jgi:ABC-type hemin transport system ATPase subunit